ncbi:MAG: protein translocase subunit SecDF [Flavobacterium sp.]|nr:protein translocase subunit SecDF [Flavobacterium sp.]
MQLKGLVRFFAIALILICIYQLSFTWFVHSHENDMEVKADKWVSANYPSANKKYSDSALRALYSDTLKELKKARLQRLLDSTKDSKIGPFGLTTYRSAKDKEVLLGLDLQGGMSVTVEVGLDGLVKSLANYTKDAAFNKALNAAVAKKANSGADFITLFTNEFKAGNPNATLAPLFAGKSNGKVKFDDKDAEVTAYLREQAESAFNNTLRILRTRIDGFGVSSPSINPDKVKAVINIELAGANDPERIRRIIQSSANLQFFEVYNIQEFGESFQNANKALQDYVYGTGKSIDSTANKDSSASSATTATENDSTKSGSISATFKDKKPVDKVAKIDSVSLSNFLLGDESTQPFKNKKGEIVFPAPIALVKIQDTAIFNNYLRLDVVKAKLPFNLVFMYGRHEEKDGSVSKTKLALYAIKTLDNGQAELEGEHVKEALQDYDEGKVSIKMNMDKVGTNIWAKMTGKNVGKPIAIVLDNFVYSAPNVNEAITGGNSSISGNYTVKEAQELADILKSGKLTATAKIVQDQVIGPTLGKTALKGGALSFLISFIVIFGLMLVYYNTAGWVANIALILNLLFTIGILAALGFTLTAPGIAGLVLTIGMAVDTNVIIFERIKEELTRGKNYATAVNDGYKRSLAPVLDAHVTTFLTAAILAYFGLGPVLGFATTQMVGIVLSLFCGILISRLVTDLYMGKNRHFNYFTGLSKKVFKHASYKFIEYRKVAYGISAVVLILGIASYFNGFDQGVEFAGGRSYTVKFTQAVNQEKLSDELKVVFGNQLPIIKTVGSANQLNITTAYRIHETGKNIDSLVETALFKGLASHLPAGTTYAEFDTKYKQSSQTVLPTISDDLKSGAQKATVFAILVICLYIFIRFRDWRYSLGTIFSLLHDVFVTLIVFSFARKIVPFPLEIDQHFIAAILTVIGFSMNDTVIVYDRIREDSKLMKGESNATIINRAINQTLSRTVMTSLTVFLTILILFIFGGEVTRGFAFAMLIGVITGTYSSIFVAAPILVDFAKDKPLGSSEVKK